MNIRDLHYLVALADHEHFGRAAEACFVSQPALSMQIKKLEESLGISLVERTNKAFFLTDNGLMIVDKARHILNQVAEMREMANALKDPFSGELRIGIFPTLAPYLLPRVVPQLVKQFPKLSFYLLEEQTASLVEKLKHGKLHAAFLALPVSEPGFNNMPLFAEEFLLAMGAAHPLSKRKTIQAQDLDSQNLLLLDEGHCMRVQALSFCQRVNASEASSFRATSLETLRHMVAAGVGITLMPKLACATSDEICYRPFKTLQPSRSIALFWRASTSKQEVLTALGAQIKKILGKQKIVTVL